MVNLNEIGSEYMKCLKDKTRIYMIENFLSTYDMRARSIVPFSLFPRQKDFLDALRTHQNNITTKPRQAGITTTTAAFLTCEIVLANPKSPETILVIGNKLDLAQQMITKIKAFIYQIPRWFWGEEYYSPDPSSSKNKKDIFTTANQNELVLFNGCRVVAKSSGTNAARGVSSVSWLVFDEAAFIENGNDVYAQAVATTSTGGHIIMISTPHGKDQLYYRTYDQARQGLNGFHITELKWFQDPRYNRELKWTRRNEETGDTTIIEEEVIDKLGNIRYDANRWTQLERDGYKPTSPWYVGMCGKFNNDEQRIAQELDVSFLGSANNIVAPEFVDMQNTLNVRDPREDLKDPFVAETWIWKPPIEGHRYLLAVDASRGDSADSTGIEVIDMDAIDDDGKPCIEQVLEYSGKKTADEIGEIVYAYATLYGNAFVVVDCIGGTGDAIILTLMRLKYKNLYYDDPMLTKYTMQRNLTVLNTTPTDKLPGFHTGAVRFQMLSSFANMVKTNAFKVRSKRLISQLETWIFKGDMGRMDHMEGCHDDLITCLAMGLFVMEFSLDKLNLTKECDVAMLSAWFTGGSTEKTTKEFVNTGFYTNKTINKQPNNPYSWVLNGL